MNFVKPDSALRLLPARICGLQNHGFCGFAFTGLHSGKLRWSMGESVVASKPRLVWLENQKSLYLKYSKCSYLDIKIR